MSLWKVFMQDLSFFIFIWAMIQNWSWNWESWHNFGLSEIWYCGQSAGNGRTVRRSWDLSTRGSAEKLSTAKITQRTVLQRTADGPPEAVQNLPEAVFSQVAVCKLKGGRSARVPRTVHEWTERWGQPDLTYIGCPSHSPPPNRTQHPKALSLSLSSTWGRRQGQGFLAWFPDGPRTSSDSSQVCASWPPGILTNP